MQVHFVGFQAVQSSEHMGSFGVFGILQVIFLCLFAVLNEYRCLLFFLLFIANESIFQLYGACQWLRTHLDADSFARALTVSAIGLLAILVVGFVAATLTGNNNHSLSVLFGFFF